HAWNRLRDGFSSNVLGTTSAAPPPGLGGGMSRATRLAVAAGSLALAFLGAFLADGGEAIAFFYPALMIAGIFGGVELALAAFVLAVALAYFLSGGDPHFWIFPLAAAVQTAVALVLRLLFRESRRWGVRYRRLLSAMSSAVTVSDGAGRIERPHPELAALIGMEWPAYAGVRWLRSIHHDDQPKLTPAGAPAGGLRRAEIRLKNPKTGDWRWHLMRAVPLLDDKGAVEEWISVLTDVHERKLTSEQREVAMGEARHRLKNLITIIEALATSSRSADRDPATEAFLAKFLGRLRALSAAGDLALAGGFSTMQAEDVTRATLAPFLEKDTQRLVIGGPRLELSEATGGALALGLNEMATNAIKYGALSVPEGRIAFTWTVTPGEAGRRVEMVWKENGGPPPQPPTKGGFGSRVIGFIPSREQGGTVTMEYPSDGYVCRIGFILPDRPRVRTLEEEDA
ncbi:MAG TPA: HWE histidine kinase domain-containing protein, partial [Rhizomicrobium sp.]